MVNNIWTYLTYGKRYTSIWIDNSNAISTYYVAEGKWINNEIEIINTFQCSNIDELINRLGKKKHSYLTLTGTGILTKRIQSDISDEKALHQTFPNIDPQQFYFSIQKQDNKRYVSVCRKSMLDKLLQEFDEHGIYFTGIALNILSLKYILPSLQTNELRPGQYLVKITDNHIDQITLNSSQDVNDRSIKLSEKSFKESFLVPIAGFGNYFLSLRHSNLNSLEKDRTTLLKEKSLFKNVLLTGISLVLVVLIVNFLFFSSYYKDMQFLKEKYQTELTKKTIIDKNKAALANKKLMALTILNTGNSKTSFYLNQLVSSAPSTILFNSIQFQPLITRLKQGKPTEIEKDLLIINGLTNNKSEFSQWIERLQIYNWISDINISDFSNESSNQSTFGLKIKILND